MTTEHDSKPGSEHASGQPSVPPPASVPRPAVGDGGARLPLASQGILTSGSRFGSYVVGPCIGQGGMARVYRAEHEGLQRQVALKVLTQGLVGSDEHDRFVREARLAAAIKHPNVVNIFDVGVENGVPYLVMEFLEGEDLDTQLQSQHRLDENAIIDIMVPVVAGLTAVHDAGVIHRDLKPGNIFLTRGRHDELEPKLLDFGISKAVGPDRGKITATRGLLMGTPFYMAPETIRGAAITELSDQYALGVVMYECATGTNPFAADSFAEVVDRVTTASYPRVSACETAISPKLSKIIEKAMSLEPENRYSTLRELGRDLLRLAGQRTRVTWGLTFGELAQNLPASGPASHALQLPAEVGNTTLPPSRGRKRALAAVLGAAGLCAAVLFGFDPLGTGTPLVDAPPERVVLNAKAVEKEPAPAEPEETASSPEASTLVDDTDDIADTSDADDSKGGETSDENEATPPPVQARRSRTTRRNKPRQRRRPVRQRRRASASAASEANAGTDRPPWALAPSSTEPSAADAKNGPVLGTNNAPILD